MRVHSQFNKDEGCVELMFTHNNKTFGVKLPEFENYQVWAVILEKGLNSLWGMEENAQSN